MLCSVQTVIIQAFESLVNTRQDGLVVLRTTASAVTGKSGKLCWNGAHIFSTCVLFYPTSLALVFIYYRYKSKADRAADITLLDQKLLPLHVARLDDECY